MFSRRIEVPIGVHGGRVGKLMAADILNAMQGLRGPMVSLGLSTSDEFDSVFAEAKHAMDSPRVRCVARRSTSPMASVQSSHPAQLTELATAHVCLRTLSRTLRAVGIRYQSMLRR